LRVRILLETPLFINEKKIKRIDKTIHFDIIKLMKKVILWTFTSILCLLLISHVFCLILASSNYKYNSKVWNELNYTGILYNQNDYGNFKYGLGNVADNGCGAVAAYNILLLEGKYKPLPEIIKYFDNGNENIFGILGTNPFGLMKYMKKEGYKVNAYLKTSDFKEAAINSKYSILMYLNLKYGHFELLYDFDGQYFKVNPQHKIDLEKLLESKKDFLKVLITIN